MLDLLSSRLPQIPGDAVIKAGAAGLLNLVSNPVQLYLLRNIWNEAIRRSMILSVALVGASVPFTLGMEWLNAKRVALGRKSKALDEKVVEHATV